MKTLIFILQILFIILPILIAVAYFTLLERKILAFMQRRRGPNVIGIFGLLQPLADGLKLILKETIIPVNSNKIIFIIAPILTFTLSLINWVIIPFDKNFVLSDINLGILFILAISSLSVYGIICAGWSSNSKYAFLGSLRSTAQMISYEISLSLIIISVIACTQSLNLTEIILFQTNTWFIFALFPAFLMFFSSALAETNRPPFDLPEAEGELVAGYNVEYSAMTFALFFLAEYSNIILMCSMIALLFMGGFLPVFDIYILKLIPGFLWFSLKVIFNMFIFIWVRAAFPRLRYDQLMLLSWKIYLPISLALLLYISSYIYFIEYLISK
jgi:NADH-quinone oxidoreductase subunit H